MSGRTLRLLPLGPPLPESALVEWLGSALASALRLPVRREEPLLLEAVDPGGRMSSNALVDLLIERHPPCGDDPPRDWLLGVTGADLFAPQGRLLSGAARLLVPERDFVFGEAALGGAWAVISTARLGADDSLEGPVLRARLLKEALHELGHVAGLPHCRSPACVMAPSVDAVEIDGKPAGFCPECRARFAGLDPPAPAR